MDGKKLNIEFAENLEANISEDNFGPINYLETNYEMHCQMNDLKAKVSELEMKASLYDDKENLYKDKLKFKDDLIEALKLSIESTKNANNNNDNDSLNKKTDNMLEQLKDDKEQISLKSKDEEIKKLKAQLKLKKQTLQMYNDTIKQNAALIKKNNVFREVVMKIKNTIYIKMEYGGTTLSMHVPKLKPFEPVLENKIAGPGWIVIQRRFNGSTDFETDLTDYYDGFGKIKDDFWLGLERIHKITSHQRHELYIHIVGFDGKTHFAKYDNFVVGSKDEKYLLKSLGKYSGNANDMMRLSENRLFAIGKKSYKCGWWWLEQATPSCNLNGKYSEKMIDNEEYLFWGLKSWGNKGNFIKSVQMLIRPLKP
ncbi:fibroleukin-like isoform X2 [Drosophila innubila]|uniref:fibroleukin-like isoform X2 n=1 Tax=Drosophila innubila TaxID=198719 RepID=UPI00148D0ABD|nr:fibroleukin-like isoform X2 [Drosophila innubila]